MTGSPENAISPTRSRLGTLSRKVLTACWAAMSLVGLMSLACIDRDASITRITVARSRGTIVFSNGRNERRRRRAQRVEPDSGRPTNETLADEARAHRLLRRVRMDAEHRHAPDRGRQRRRRDGTCTVWNRPRTATGGWDAPDVRT